MRYFTCLITEFSRLGQDLVLSPALLYLLIHSLINVDFTLSKMNLGCCVATLKGHCLPRQRFHCTCCRWTKTSITTVPLVIPQYDFLLCSFEIAQEHLVSGRYTMLISVPHLHFPCCFRVPNFTILQCQDRFDAVSVSWLPSTPFCSWLALCSESQRRETDQPCVPIYNNRDAVRVAAVGREKFC